jgi:hypothetical protein
LGNSGDLKARLAVEQNLTSKSFWFRCEILCLNFFRFVFVVDVGQKNLNPHINIPLNLVVEWTKQR